MSGAPAVQDRLVLALIISAAKVCLAHWMYELQRPPASVYALSSVCSPDEPRVGATGTLTNADLAFRGDGVSLYLTYG